MGVFYETIPPSLLTWIPTQKLFFVSTAPLSAQGHVNVSPKGGPAPLFGIPDPKTFWYLDMTGSGSETIAHLHEPRNGRVTIMFCAFEGSPKIVRLWGRGRVLERGTAEFNAWVAKEKIRDTDHHEASDAEGEAGTGLSFGARSIVVVDIHQVGSSCGFQVPLYDFRDYRLTLQEHFERREAKFRAGDPKESMPRYWAQKNAWSVDGLPGMRAALETAKQEGVAPIRKMVGEAGEAVKKGGPPKGLGFVDVGMQELVRLGIVALVAFVIGVLLTLRVVAKVEDAQKGWSVGGVVCGYCGFWRSYVEQTCDSWMVKQVC